MIRTLRTLAAAAAIGCLGLAVLPKAVDVSKLPSQRFDLKTVTGLQVRDSLSTRLYSGIEDVPDESGDVPLSYHRLDGSWAFQKVEGIPLSRKKNIPAPDGGTSLWQYLTFQDDSIEFVALRDDDRGRLSGQSFFALNAGEDELDGRHLQSKVLYADDGKTLADKKELWYSGNTRQWMHLEADGRRHFITYAHDGKTMLGDQWFNKPPDSVHPATIKSEKRWLDDAQHTLCYSDEQKDDGTRTIFANDKYGNKLWEAHWAKGDIVSGTIVDGYYPLTGKLHYHSESQINSDKVVYLREDGTIAAKVDIGDMTLSVDYYDKTGMTVRLSQAFMRTDRPDFNLDKASYALSLMTEYDDAGKKTRDMSFSNGRLTMLERVNDTVDGVAYANVVYFFDEQGLTLVTYWNEKNKINGGPDRVDHHPKPLNIVAVVPPEEGTLQLVFGDDMLPVPPFQASEHGS
jgi:hypothetical protein